VVVVVVGARLRLDSGRRLPWDPGEGVAQRLSGSDVTLSIVTRHTTNQNSALRYTDWRDRV
jgi:hypothetical protein